MYNVVCMLYVVYIFCGFLSKNGHPPINFSNNDSKGNSDRSKKRPHFIFGRFIFSICFFCLFFSTNNAKNIQNYRDLVKKSTFFVNTTHNIKHFLHNNTTCCTMLYNSKILVSEIQHNTTQHFFVVLCCVVLCARMELTYFASFLIM